ncbi:unnamed protein product [Rotaria socialis]
MYQNFRVALELTGKRLQRRRAIENNRHRRTINESSTTSVSDEIIDLNTNFNISQTEYSPTELDTDLNAHCNSPVSTDDELLIFDDILQSNDIMGVGVCSTGLPLTMSTIKFTFFYVLCLIAKGSLLPAANNNTTSSKNQTIEMAFDIIRGVSKDWELGILPQFAYSSLRTKVENMEYSQ